MILRFAVVYERVKIDRWLLIIMKGVAEKSLCLAGGLRMSFCRNESVGIMRG